MPPTAVPTGSLGVSSAPTLMESVAPHNSGMQSIKELLTRQEAAPPGGFPAIRYARRLPNTGPTGATLFAVGTVVSLYGFYKIGVMNSLRRERREEVLQARKNVFPYLQAEHDLRYQAQREVVEAFEADVMSDVEGWEVGKCVYKTREWVAPKPKYGAFQYVFD